MNDKVRVFSLSPFWRYAVGPTNTERSPAIPYYTLKSAQHFFNEAKKALPWAGVVMYKRVWFKGVETIQEYIPTDVYENLFRKQN